MSSKNIHRIIVTITCLVFSISCVKEIEQQPQEGLHEVVFHASWAPETKTVLQEDGSVWWSPGDEISLFVKGENGYNENNLGRYGYRLSSTNSEDVANTTFVGKINEPLSNAPVFAIYPYRQYSSYNGVDFKINIPNKQVACEGTFNKEQFVSAAISDNNYLYLKNLCGGIKFSVANEGIKKIVIDANEGDCVAGTLHVSSALEISWDDNGVLRSRTLEIAAPNDGTFVPGAYYYIILPAMVYHGLRFTYYQEKGHATFKESSDIHIKRSVFKRLYNKDAGLAFSKAELPSPILPDGIDKTIITEVNLYVDSEKMTDIVVGNTKDGYEPIYLEQEGTILNFHTRASEYEMHDAVGLFQDWNSLVKADLANLNTEECKSFANMFMDCSSLKSLNVSSFNTSNATSLYGMFSGCKQLKTLDVSGFKTSSVTNFGYMFYNCHNLDHIDVSQFDLSSAEDVSDMFFRCYLLSVIDTHNWKSSKIVNMNRMFTDCRSVSSLDLSGLELSNVNNMQSMFQGCSNLADLKLSKISTPHLITWGLGAMFADCQKLKALDLSNFNTSDVEDFSDVFYQCYNLKSLNLNGWNTSNATTMRRMFLGCSSLQNVDLSMFDTSKVTDMNKLFSGCGNLEKLDLSNWDTSSVTDLSCVFEGCRNLETLDISGFSSDHLSDVYAMFGYTHKLSAINMGDFNISSLSMQNTFFEMAKNTPHCYIRCTESQKITIEPNLSNLEKITWITDGSALPDDISSIDESLYYSTDYSKDKTVKVLQKASEGTGVDMVLMGDGYSDKMIASGEYDRDMERTVESIFLYEPFKSFRHLFNIYITYAVSENEEIGKSTVFDSYDTRATTGHIGSNDTQRILSYSMNASGKGDPRDVATIVVLNSEVSDGVCINFLHASAEGEVFDYHNDPNWDDYHGGNGYAVVSGPKQDGYEETVIHEFGHLFGKLADEYVNDGDDYQSISEQEKLNLQIIFPYGMYKNIDVTNSPSSIKWSRFLTDSRYSNSGTGIFEGADQYRTGVWRPSENSIMRNMSGQFNAPSREAIYYRIHKLAYGKDWQYNFEDFVQWDLKNIQSESKVSTQSVPYPARLNERKPFFKMEKIRDTDGQEVIRMIMN